MKTPDELQKRYGLSYGMIRKYVMDELPQGVAFSKHMNLNGTSKKVIQAIADRVTDPGIKEMALNDLEQMSKPVERPVEQSKRYVDQWLSPVECTLNGFSLSIEQSLNEIKSIEPEEKETVNISKSIFNGVQSFFEFDLGRAILGSPLIRFAFVCTMVFAQAFMFASLEQKVMKGMNLNLPFVAAFMVGVIFEFAGFMIASTFKASKGLNWGKREWWLFFITLFQFGTNYFLLEPHTGGSWMIGLGRGMICLAPPAGLMAYSVLYFKE